MHESQCGHGCLTKPKIVGQCVLKHHSESPFARPCRIIGLLFIIIELAFPAFAVPLAHPGKAKKVEKTHINPSLRAIKGQLIFDQKTKEALERSKETGVLLALEENPGLIYKISITGAQKVEPDAVILRLKSKIDEPYEPAVVAQDIQEIWKMGLFSNVEVWQHVRKTGAIELEYRLSEIPTIFDIKITGNQALADSEIKESLAGLENYQVAKPERLRAAAEKIRELYVSKGYYLATVTYSIEKTTEREIKEREAEGVSEKGISTAIEIETAKVSATDFVNVIFHIKENAKVLVRRISFIGNHRLSDEELKKDLRTHEEHALSILTDWGTFRKDYLEIDALILEKMLHDNGMLKGKILAPEVELSSDKSSIRIAFRMIEGEQYFLGDVTVDGDLVEKDEEIYRLRKARDPERPLFSEQQLLAEITEEKGDIFNKSRMGQNVMAIADKYKDAGYAYVNVSPEPTFDEENKLVNIHINIESGPRVKIERIDIEGNEKTMDEVIRREVLITEGDYYSATLLHLSEANLAHLGYFESVELIEETGSSPNQMIIKIRVKERSTGNIQAGAGWGTGGEGLVFRFQVSNQNLFGRGQSLSATVNWSNYRRMFDVMFAEPYLTYVFDQPLTLSFSAFNRDLYMGEFYRAASGGDLTFGYPIGSPFKDLSRRWKTRTRPSLQNYVLDFESLWFYLTYTAERVQISDSSLNVRSFDLHQDEPRYTTSIKPTLRLDQRDNRIAPTRGIFAEFRTEFASGYFGALGLSALENKIRNSYPSKGLDAGRSFMKPSASVNNFIRYGTNVRFYHNLDDWFFVKGLVFKTNLELGILNTLGEPLIFENYALGGLNTIRGYSYRSISPVESAGALFPFNGRRDVAIGGNKQFYGSFELEFPLIKLLKLKGVLFFDFGNVFSPSDNFFFIGGKSANASHIKPSDPLGLYRALGLYSSVGFGVRWDSPFALLRFEWGIPLNVRPSNTPGLIERDRPILFEFNVGPSF